jgi:hypothetical protein
MKKLEKRLQEINEAISLSTGFTYFSVGQRICLHQERAGLFRNIEELQLFGEVQTKRYKAPKHLEQKIQKLIYS